MPDLFVAEDAGAAEKSRTGYANSNFSQTNQFDFVGRLKYNNVANPGVSNPYSTTVGYDAFGNITSRTNNLYAFNPVSFNASYTNNRKTPGGSGASNTFDKAGNVTQAYLSSDIKNWDFDAAGRSVRWTEAGPWGPTQQKGGEAVFDGDGRSVKESDVTNTLQGGVWSGWDAIPKYNIFSSVTGEKITELNDTGAFYRNYLYMGHTEVAWQRRRIWSSLRNCDDSLMHL
jgi:hypothetical protein